MKNSTPEARSPAASEGSVAELMMPQHVNNLGHVFGGVVLSLVDRAAGVVAMRLYQTMIERVRYRDGKLAGYPSRLHYFSEWLSDNEKRGIVRIVTRDLGGVVDAEPITFMSQHRDAYKQLADDNAYREIGRIEARLRENPRYYIPKAQVGSIMSRLEDGDVLALTTTVAGLDVVHTGIAFWKDGAVHLLNAPLVGKTVEISEKNIHDRLAGIRSQDGLMVARPVERNLVLLGK